MDGGGLSREFWRLFVKDVIQKYCIGDCGECIFERNIPALRVSVFISLVPLSGDTFFYWGNNCMSKQAR